MRRKGSDRLLTAYAILVVVVAIAGDFAAIYVIAHFVGKYW